MRYQDNSGEMVEVAVEMLRETEKAYLFTDGDTESWLPKSMIDVKVSRGGKPTLIELPEWLAKKEGLI